MASLPIWHHPVVRSVVLALSPQLPQFGRDDAGEGSDSRPYDGVSLGALLMLQNWTSDAGHTCAQPTTHGGWTKLISRSKVSGNISTGLWILKVTP